MQRLLFLLFFLLFTALPALAGVNINTASQSELESLPGIGPSKATAIIQYRTDHGPFTSVDQLDNVSGIGAATLNNIRAQVEIGDGQTVTPASESASAPASGSTQAGAVNINTASGAQLETLSGIGPSKAAAIIADRDANGPFSSCSDLQRVRGIGAATVAGLAGGCTVE